MEYSEEITKTPILIVNKRGILGDSLALELGKKSPVVYVSQKKPIIDKSDNIIFSEYGKSIPVIPNNIYSHLLVVVNGNDPAGFLSEFIKRAKKIQSQLIFIVNLSDSSSFYKKYKKTEDLLSRAKSKGFAKIVIFGEIFDKNIHLPFIQMAARDEEIEIEGDGLSQVYPVFLDDAVSSIIDSVFDTSSSIFYVFPKYPPTELSFARMIQKTNPNISIDFVGGSKREKNVHFPTGGKYLLSDNYPLEKRIKELNIKDMAQTISKKADYYISPVIKRKKSIKSSFFTAFLSFLSFLIFLPLFSTLIFSFLGFVTLGNAKTGVEKGNLLAVQKSINVSKIYFDFAKKSADLLMAEARLIGQEDKLGVILRKISLGQDLSTAADKALKAAKMLNDVFKGESRKPKEDFLKATGHLKDTVVVFRQKEGEEGISKDFVAEIKSMESIIKIAENTIDVLPSLFGFDGKKTYLILFQNNMELRPGGGFIGSYGLLTMNSGRVENFSIADVYDADGQLKEHVEPPYAIRRHLGVVHWYLRDSNFNVDFLESASSARLLLSKELGIETDGIIGIDVTFLEYILEAIGDVYVSDYRQSVGADNVYEVTQSHAEKNFFPGSRQKKNFLNSLFSSIQASIGEGGNLPYLALAKKISRALDEKHLLFVFSDSNIQDIFTANGWSSTISKAPKNTSVLGSMDEEAEVFSDFLGINEANLGVNKANYFINRKIFHNVSLDEKGRVSGAIKIQYHNSSKGWPGGDYANYLRIILPLNAMLLSVSFDGTSQQIIPAVTDFRIYEAEGFVAPPELEVERYDQDGKTIYGFLVSVEAGKSKEVEIEYNLAQKIPSDAADFSYSLRVFKQPGTGNYPYSFSLTYPDNFKVIDGLDSFFGKLERDKDINAGFAPR